MCETSKLIRETDLRTTVLLPNIATFSDIRKKHKHLDKQIC